MGKYKRKTNRQSWNEECMRQAIEEVLEGRMGYLKASKQFGVPRTTVEARVNKIKKGKLERKYSAKKGLGRHRPVFSEAQEEELVKHILYMESRLFGFTLSDLRSLAYQLAERNGLAHQFNKDKKMAGKTWLYKFLERHPNVKLRTPEPTSLARAMGFNRPAVQKFFSLLSDVLEKYKIPPERIYNVDETGIMTVPKKRSKCLSLRGKKQVGCISSAERGILVTLEICMSASGVFMPPTFIFPRSREKPELLDDAPPGSKAFYHSSGWMQKEIFFKWFILFIEFSNASIEHPVLLLLDGHTTHTKNLEVIQRARDCGVIMLCFPPHTTHRLQPLDVSFMSPLSSYYTSEVQKWMQQHPGRPVTISQIGKLFGSAYMRAASIQTAVNGFRKTGIQPLNPEIFEDWMFEPAETTNMPAKNLEVGPFEENKRCTPARTPSPIPQNQVACEEEEEARHNTENIGNSLRTPSPHLVTPQKSHQPLAGKENTPPSVSCTKFYGNVTPSCSYTITKFQVTPEQIVPLPHAERKMNAKDKRRGKTAVLTSTPYKEELETSIAKPPIKKPKLNLDETQKVGNNKGKNKITNVLLTKKKEKKERKKRDSSSEEEEDNDESCIYCTELYSKSKTDDGWVMCQDCRRWAHEACAGVENDYEAYSCDFCRD